LTDHKKRKTPCISLEAMQQMADNTTNEILQLETRDEIIRESQKLLNWGFLQFDTVKLYTKNQAIVNPPVWKGSQTTVPLGFNNDVYVSLPRGMLSKIKPVIERPDPLIAPIAQYARVATLKIMGDGKVLIELPLQALEQVNSASLFGRAIDSLRMFFQSQP
jgi:D-alanyl-D-alanine carboxypeptidase (penicillin-binding protein 5/6)